MDHLWKQPAILLCPVIGLLIGGGWGIVESAKNSQSQEISSTSARDRKGSSPLPKNVVNDLLEESRRQIKARALDDRSETAKAISRWSDEDVLAAITDIAGNSEKRLSHATLYDELLGEYSKRDPERALEWLLAQPEHIRGGAAYVVLSGWLPDRPHDALAVLNQHSDIFGRIPPRMLVDALLNASAEKGASAFVAQAIELHQVYGAPILGGPEKYPPDFEFAAVLNSPEFQSGDFFSMKSSLRQGWITQDREGAFQWWMKNPSPASLIHFQKAPAEVGRDEATESARWLAKKVEALPREQLDEFIYCLSTRAAWGGTPYLGAIWADVATDSVMKETALSTALRGVFQGDTHSTNISIITLESLPDVESRLKALENLDRENLPPRKMLPESEKMLRAKFHEWGVDSNRVEAIMKHITE